MRHEHLLAVHRERLQAVRVAEPVRLDDPRRRAGGRLAAPRRVDERARRQQAQPGLLAVVASLAPTRPRTREPVGDDHGLVAVVLVAVVGHGDGPGRRADGRGADELGPLEVHDRHPAIGR
ncbi:MAG TPA: hypothetical protein VF158_11830 [Longimicrobiales bacterium]